MATHAELKDLLAEKGLTLGSAESLTGGLFGATFCEIPGASTVYKGGIIAYTPEVKTALLGVPAEMIESKGVVSAAVAASMARGGAKTLGVDICVSCTGNAGPDVQEGGEPVGKVFLGVYYNNSTWTIPVKYLGSRNEIRKGAVETMFAFIASLFEENKNK